MDKPDLLPNGANNKQMKIPQSQSDFHISSRRKIANDIASGDDLQPSNNMPWRRLQSERDIANRYATRDGRADETLIYDEDNLLDYRIQIILIGDRSVGKTSFLQRYSSDIFMEHLNSTVGIDFKFKTLDVQGKRVRLQIWDTAGQERFNSITTAYYRNARGIILFYDVTNMNTFRNLQNWINLVEEFGQKGAKIAIVGSKADLPDTEVDTDKARKFAESRGYLFFETSAKESLNVSNVFNDLVNQIVTQIETTVEAYQNKKKAASSANNSEDQVTLRGQLSQIRNCC